MSFSAAGCLQVGAVASATEGSRSNMPMPRVLCLHGGATSASIFRHQLRTLESNLDGRAELFFVDGRKKVANSMPEVERAFPGGPYYAHLERVMDEEPETTSTMGTYIDKEEGVSWLMDVLDQQGPFAAWIGFSQGANLALMALHHLSTEMREPELPSSTRWPGAVIFMCPTQFGWFEPGTPPFHSGTIRITCVSGKLDPRISRSRAFISDCLSPALRESAVILEHPEGHRPLPGEPGARKALVDILVPQLLDACSGGNEMKRT